MLATSANINIYQVAMGKEDVNISYYIACGTLSFLLLYFVGLFIYLMRHSHELYKEKCIQRVGNVYKKYDVFKGKSAVAVISTTHVRNLCLSVAITFGTGSLIFQIFFFNFSSLVILALIGHLRPFKSKFIHWHEIYNEFIIHLVLFGILICQTNFVANVSARSTMGWVLIAIIIFNVFTNFSLTFFANGHLLKLKIRRCLVKCKKSKTKQSPQFTNKKC